MNWLIEEQEGVVVTKMSSNKLNLMNDAFFNDLNNAFDIIENESPDKPVILTAVGNVFSAGLDINHCFPIFQTGDLVEIEDWLKQFSDSILRVFKFKQPIIAAVNGHAIAGGLILALCCDIRFAVSSNAKFGLNEVTIGFPMPSVFAAIIRYVLGQRRAEEVLLKGWLYEPDEALKLGFFHDITDAHNLMVKALSHAKEYSDDNIYAYSHAKTVLRSPTVKRIENHSLELDRGLPSILASEKVVDSLGKMLDSLKKRSEKN